MKYKSKSLREELKLAGASDSEIKDLLGVASNLKQLKNAENIASHIKPHSKWKIILPVGITSLVGIVIGMALVIFSQTVLPSSFLYPVQKFSDSVSMSIDPSYRGTVMMKRAQQVKQLISEHANPNLVYATIANYQSEASAYKSVSTNYAAFEYCKDNLVQAAAMAPAPERQAIDNSLRSLSNV